MLFVLIQASAPVDVGAPTGAVGANDHEGTNSPYTRGPTGVVEPPVDASTSGRTDQLTTTGLDVVVPPVTRITIDRCNGCFTAFASAVLPAGVSASFTVVDFPLASVTDVEASTSVVDTKTVLPPFLPK